MTRCSSTEKKVITRTKSSRVECHGSRGVDFVDGQVNIRVKMKKSNDSKPFLSTIVLSRKVNSRSKDLEEVKEQ
jgi:hypothetical protein